MTEGTQANTAGPSARPRRTYLRTLATVAAVYLATLGVFLMSNLIQGEHVGVTLLVGVPMVIGDAVLSLPLVATLLASEGRPPRRRFVLIALLVLLTALVHSGWDAWVRVEVGTIPADRYGASLRRSLSLNIYAVGMLAALIGFQTAYLRLRASNAALLGAREGERTARLESLRLQLNPHFLFNTLNALSSLVVTGRAPEAEEMIDRLSDFLRNALSADPAGVARLEDEIEAIEGYLEIERVRFGDRLRTRVELPRALADVEVPQLLLQPLVENAMKYGVAASRRPVCVTIAAVSRGGFLELRVTDDAVATEPVHAPGTGVGLANVRNRLALHYGAAAQLVTVPGETGFAAIIRLPAARPPPGTDQARPSALSTAAR